MIATVTLNPAVDKTLKTSGVVLGAVNRMDEVSNIAGGKGINVTKVLRKYGAEVATFGFLGGYSGNFIKEAVLKMGARDKFTQVMGETRTSINVIGEDGYVTELLEPGPNITQDELDSFTDTFKEGIKECDVIVLSGSVPIGVPSSIYADLISYANAFDKKVLLDSSGDYLKKGMYARPHMMKPNLKELEALLGRRIQGMQEVAEAASMIVEWGVPNVLVSMGAKGILYALDRDDRIKVYYCPAPSVNPVNTVGSGDSAVAAFALSMTEGLSPEDTLKRCVAVSVANTLTIENGVIDLDKVKEIEAQLNVSTLN